MGVPDENCRCLGDYFDRASPLVVGCEQLDDLVIDGEILAIVAPLTGGIEHVILRIFEKLSDRSFLPLAPYLAMNSLPATLESFSALKGSGRAWVVAEWPPGPRIGKFVRAWRAIEGIRGARIGLIEEPSPWLVHSSGVVVEEGLRKCSAD